MKLLDLFSGIGGFSLGLERAGFRTVAFCEVAPACRHLLAHHWPGVPCYDDVRTLTAERLMADGIEVEAICGGFPCQDISYAGKGAGIRGERSGLWSEYARLIGEIRPRLVFVENVAALLGRGMGVVLGDLAALGYDAWWDCIPAAAVGAPHRRDRLWLVAYPGGVEHQGHGDAIRRTVAAGLSYAGLANAKIDHEPGQSQIPNDERTLVGSWARTGSGAELRNTPSRSDELESNSIASVSCTLADAEGQRVHRGGTRAELAGRREPSDGCWWLSEPDVGRVAHGVPARVDRLHGLGNAVVPQIPELLGRAALRALA